MAGVEILAMKEVVTNSIFNWSVFWIAFVIAFGIFTIVGLIVAWGSCNWSEIIAFVLYGAVLGVLVGAVIGSDVRIPTEYGTQYKVIISDEVPMNEFIEKYEIIGQDGKIFTVVERN